MRLRTSTFLIVAGAFAFIAVVFLDGLSRDLLASAEAARTPPWQRAKKAAVASEAPNRRGSSDAPSEAGPVSIDVPLTPTPTPLPTPQSDVGGRSVPPSDLKPWPEDRAADSALCGTWQDEYRIVHGGPHADFATNGRKYSAFQCRAGEVCGGIADRILGMMTGFMFAIMTNRTFVLDLFIPGFPYTYHNVPPNGGDLVPALGTRGDWGSDYVMVDILHWASITKQFLMETDLNTHYPQRLVVWRGNRGAVIPMFSNPHHKAALQRTGLRPEVAWGCMFNFLMRPRPEVLLEHEKDTAALRDPTTFVIGMHIRAGDENIGKTPANATRLADGRTLDNWQSWLDCAFELEHSIAGGRPTRWYFLSDSLTLRQMVVNRYGNKTINMEVREPGHVTGNAADSENVAHNVTGYVGVAEHWLYGLCDAWVMGDSGYSKTGAARGMLPDRIFWGDRRRNCTVGNHATLDELGWWSGM
eukprot:TRINITY_DN3150_c0_g1_i1.p1 TRINITY_DN3150_c0_g1~~TRINITY_DN3150_c0_g1_i1.p1  ORF type:complete len:471 (-),score=103.10 TRINITY_DN3150_c0_g1_i1:384-1796(-)